jgi:hypothetical protein
MGTAPWCIAEEAGFGLAKEAWFAMGTAPWCITEDVGFGLAKDAPASKGPGPLAVGRQPNLESWKEKTMDWKAFRDEEGYVQYAVVVGQSLARRAQRLLEDEVTEVNGCSFGPILATIWVASKHGPRKLQDMIWAEMPGPSVAVYALGYGDCATPLDEPKFVEVL